MVEEKSKSRQLHVAIDSSDEELDGDLFDKPEDKGDDPVVKKEKGEGEGLVKREKSKAELEMMQRAMEKLKKSAIIKQVAGGREFKVHNIIGK